MRLVYTRTEQIDGVHRAWIVDIVGRDQRSIHCARRKRMHELIQEVFPVRGIDENAIHPEVLVSDGGIEVGPLWIGRVGGGMKWTWTDMAKSATHANTIGPNEVGIVVIILVRVIPLGIPSVLCRLVEIGIRKEPQANDARCGAEIGANRQL